jgi:hypothetical protein
VGHIGKVNGINGRLREIKCRLVMRGKLPVCGLVYGRNGRLREISCRFEVCKLVQAKKNGLDFYIATRLGAIFGEGYDGLAAVVSKDEGFSALRDYWASRAKPSRRVVIHGSIERAIVSAGGKEPRTRAATHLLKSQDIGSFYAAFEERQKLRAQLAEAFAGTEYMDRTEEIETVLLNGVSAKVIYLDALRSFGRKDGLAIYRKLKDCVKL